MLKNIGKKMNYQKVDNREFGFTLVELLIVIVIIAILGGLIFGVLQPGRQQQKSREGVLFANGSKVCTALYSCGSTTTDATGCDTLADIGVTDPVGNPPGSTYVLSPSPAASPTDTITVTSTLGACVGTCSYNFAAGNSVSLVWANCII